jgi:hypothetical protein
MPVGGALAHRFSVHRFVAVGSIVFGAALYALLDAWSGVAVACGLILSGFLGGGVDVTMNAEGARIERRLGKLILARLHAAASAGMAIGGDARKLHRRECGALGLRACRRDRLGYLRPASPMMAPPAASATRRCRRDLRSASPSPP